MSMTSNKPYLVRAFYDWIVDNNCTPYIVVNALDDGVEVPQDYVTDGQIVLNLSPSSVKNMLMDLNSISFSARFGGIPMTIALPVSAVMGIYAKENGQGMVFQPEMDPEPDPKGPQKKGPKAVSSTKNGLKSVDKSGSKKPSLHVVK